MLRGSIFPVINELVLHYFCSKPWPKTQAYVNKAIIARNKLSPFIMVKRSMTNAIKPSRSFSFLTLVLSFSKPAGLRLRKENNTLV